MQIFSHAKVNHLAKPSIYYILFIQKTFFSLLLVPLKMPSKQDYISYLGGEALQISVVT